MSGFLTPLVAQRMQDVLAKLEQSSSVWDEFVTFPANMQVETVSGPIPSLRWLIENHLQLVTNAIANIRSISQILIDPNTSNLVVQYTDGSAQPVGYIGGEDGKDGLSVVNVELFIDPLEPDNVYFQTELSNGVVLRTQNSIAGFNGKSIKSMVLIDNHFHVTLDDNNELPPIPIEGLTPISIAGAEIRDGELFIKLTNNAEISAGLAEGLKGRGIVDIRKTDGVLEIAYSTDPSTYIAVGLVDGLLSLQQVDNVLVAVFDSAPETPVPIGLMTSLIGGRISEDNHLILITNAPEGANEIDLGVVTNLRPRDGDNGLSVTGARLENNHFIFTVGQDELPPVPVTGLSPANIVGAQVRAGMLYFVLSNGQEIEAGLASDLRGAGLVSARLDLDGKLYFFYQDAPEVAVLVGNVPGIAAMSIENGRLLVRYTNNPTAPVDVGPMLSVTNVRLEGHELIVTLNNNTNAVVGTLLALADIRVVNNVLTVTYNDGRTVPLANVKGDPGIKGDQGRGIVSAIVNAAGDLEITWNDGSPNEIAGRVRDPILNFIGKTYRYAAADGQTSFAAANGGEVMVFVNGVLKYLGEDFDLDIANTVTFNGGLVAGDKVVIVAYQFVGTTPSGRGIQDIQDNEDGTYDVELENGTRFIIDTRTAIDPSTLPAGVVSINVQPNGVIRVELTDGNIFDAGSANNAISLIGAVVNGNGDLIIETNDPANRFINAGSVLSGLMIQSAEVNQANGHLILTLSSGTELDAGKTGNYVTAAEIRPNDGMLQITLSNGTVFDAGTVRNPLIGTMFDFICFEGQYEFDVPHSGYQVLVWANGVALQGADLVLNIPSKVRLRTPRIDLDVVRVVLLTAGNVAAASLVGESAAARNTFYGKNAAGAMGFHSLVLNKYGVPYDFRPTHNQTLFDVTHSGQVEVIFNGQYLHEDQYTLPPGNTVLQLHQPCTEVDRLRVIVLNAPRAMGDFEILNYLRVKQVSNGHGGTFTAGVWQIRALNTILQNMLGASLNSNRIILPAGVYYIRGWAACNGVAMNALRVYNQTTRKVLLDGEGVFASRAFERTMQPSNCLTPIEGYFEVTTQSSIIIQHKCLLTKATYGFGAVGGGHSTSVQKGNIGGSYWTENTQIPQSDFGSPATLADLQLWKVG